MYSSFVADFVVKNIIKEKNSPQESKTDDFLTLKSLIKNYISRLKTLKSNLKQQKDIYDDSFESDVVYHENSEKAKEASAVKSSTKQQILKQPALMELSEKIDDIRLEIKESEENLSDYLIQYQRLSGLSEIETDEGERMLIVQKARLVKSTPK